MKSLLEHWSELVWELTISGNLATAVDGIQRIHSSYVWEVPAEDFMFYPIPLDQSGYKKQKLTQLTRHYTPQNVERAISDLKARLKKRKYGSGVIYFQGEKKKNTKQDWCMTAMVVSYYPKINQTRIALYYRTAEAIKRFRGDLVYLNDVVLPMFRDIFDIAPPSLITFNFANITLHPMYWLLMIANFKDWKEKLTFLRKHDPDTFRDIVYWCWGYLLDPKHALDKYSSARQVRVIAERLTPHIRLIKFKNWLSATIKRDAIYYPDKVQAWSKKSNANLPKLS